MGKSVVSVSQNHAPVNGPSGVTGKPLRVAMTNTAMKQPVSDSHTPEKYKMPLSKHESPAFPSIPSEEEDRHGSSTSRPPDWATTPALRAAMASQSASLHPEEIFGAVQPIKLEEFFTGAGKRFHGRPSTSGLRDG